MKAVILARISSKEQGDGHSLDTQVRDLELYAQRKNLHILKKYTLVESSTRKQHHAFDQMIDFIKAQSCRQEISLLQEELHGRSEQFKTVLSTIVLLSSKALETLKSSKTSIQRSLISFIFSNLQLRGEKISGQ